MKTNLSRGLGVCLGLSLAIGTAVAAPVVGGGQFNTGGTVYVSANMLDFGFFTVPPPGDQASEILLPTTGVFSYLTAGTVVPMGNLNLASATVTATNIDFDGAVPDWITLPANTGAGLPGIDLSVNDIPITVADPVCSASTPANTPCRAFATSPIILNQTSTGVTAIMDIQGDAYYVGGTPATGTAYNAVLSASFSNPPENTIAGLLAFFASNGSVTTGFQANFSTVPEPGTVTALGIGLLVIGLINKKKRNAKRDL